jgi:hypothetical protein
MKIIALAGLVLASGAQAATYDAYSSFNGTQGAGHFVYLSLPSGQGGTATPLTENTGCVVPNTICQQLPGVGLPGAYKSTVEFHNGSYTVPDDRLLIHPGTQTAVAAFFIAPHAGTYNYTASFDILDDSPTGVGIFRLTNAGGTPVNNSLAALTQPKQAFGNSGSITLAAGQFLAFGVSNLGNYANDSTGFSFRLTDGVPEPASWATMIAGFALAGSALRARRRSPLLA